MNGGAAFGNDDKNDGLDSDLAFGSDGEGEYYEENDD